MSEQEINSINISKEEDNGAINKIEEIDNVSNIENHAENKIPMIILCDEEDDDDDTTMIIPVVNKVNFCEKILIDDNAEEPELVENLIKDALLPKDNEQNSENEYNDEVNKKTVEISKEDNEAINELEKIDNVSNIENHAENKIPMIILCDEEDDDDDTTMIIPVVNKVNFCEKILIDDNAEEPELVENLIKDALLPKDNEQNSENEYNDEVNKKTVEISKEDNEAINELEKIDNVSNIENHAENKIPMIILCDEEDEDDTIIITVVNKVYLSGKNKTDDIAEEPELVENLIKDALLPKDNEQKSENEADKNSDEQEIKLVECNDNSEEEIPKKRKNEHENEPQKRKKSQ